MKKLNFDVIIISIFLIILLVVIGCGQTDKPITVKDSSAKNNSPERVLKDSTLTINYRQVLIDIFSPARKVVADVLVLPGYSFKRTSWCENSRLCKMAADAGFRLIMPEMDRSVYNSQVYPWTMGEYKNQITLPFLCDSLMAYIRDQFGCFKNRPVFVLGLSTGGRGVAQVCLYLPHQFTAAAALSGDFDQSQMPDDLLSTAIYGAFSEHSDLWKTVDNPVHDVKKFITPVYLGCGLKDQVVPPAQTKLFYDALKKAHPGMNVILHEDENAGHDYTYWDSELPAVFDFFKSFIK